MPGNKLLSPLLISTVSLNRTTLGVDGLLLLLDCLLAVDCLEEGRKAEEVLDCLEFGRLVMVLAVALGALLIVFGDFLAFTLLVGRDVFTLLSTIIGLFTFLCLLFGLDVLTAESIRCLLLGLDVFVPLFGPAASETFK